MIGLARSILVAAVLGAVPALAQDAEEFTLGGDVYAAGSAVAVTTQTAGDAFLAGETVDVAAPVGGSAHLAGRYVDVAAPVAGNLYAAGQTVRVGAEVSGAASLAGAEVTVAQPVAGNLRAAAAQLRVNAEIGGSALLMAEELSLSAPILGDAWIAGDDIRFGPEATVAGRLVVYVDDPEEFAVPERVAAADRVSVREVEEAARDLPDPLREAGRQSVRAAVLGFLWAVLVVAAVSAFVVAVAPGWVASVRMAALDRPGRAVLAGFAGLSFLVGSGFVLALTVIGLLLLPATLLLSGLAGVAGYIAGSYVLGVGLWQRTGHAVPQDWPGKAGLAVLGALVAAVLSLIPVIGWIAVLGLVFLGLGGMVLRLLQGPAPG